MKRYAHAWDRWVWVVVGSAFAAAFFVHGASWAIALLFIAWVLIVAALVPLVPTLFPGRALRWTGITVCAVLAVVSLVYALIGLAQDGGARFGWGLVWAGLFGVSAVLLWRRAGRRRAAVAFGLWVLGSVALYVVIVELHMRGYFRGP